MAKLSSKVVVTTINVDVCDWFAKGAMQAILISLKERGIQPKDVPKMATDCYFIADAMLAERAKREGGKS